MFTSFKEEKQEREASMMQILHCFQFWNNLRLQISTAFCMIPLDMQFGGHWVPFSTSFFRFNVHRSVHHFNILLHIIATRYTIHRIYFYLTLFYMFRVLSPPILRSTKQLHLQHLVNITPYYCLLLSWKSWNWFGCVVGGVRHPQHTQISLVGGKVSSPKWTLPPVQPSSPKWTLPPVQPSSWR
jgi:hypothetical protein